MDRQVRFERLLDDETYRGAQRFALRISAARPDGEDLLQESLARAFVSLDQLRDDASFRPWLFSIIRRRFIRLRGKRRETALDPQLIERHGADDGSRDPGKHELAHLLDSLPEMQRSLLTLFYIEGLSLAECGTVLGISERAAKQRLYRARNALRKSALPQNSQRDYSGLL